MSGSLSVPTPSCCVSVCHTTLAHPAHNLCKLEAPTSSGGGHWRPIFSLCLTSQNFREEPHLSLAVAEGSVAGCGQLCEVSRVPGAHGEPAPWRTTHLPPQTQAGLAQTPLGMSWKGAAGLRWETWVTLHPVDHGSGAVATGGVLPVFLHCHPWPLSQLPRSAQHPDKPTEKPGPTASQGRDVGPLFPSCRGTAELLWGSFRPRVQEDKAARK